MESSSANSLLILASLLLVAHVAALVARRLGVPSVLGVIVAGLVAGPAALGLVESDGALAELGHLGIVLLMFLAGLETDADGIKAVGKTAFWVAAGGVVLPMAGGTFIGLAFGLEMMHALFLGAILTATSVSITAETLKELGRTRSREGSIILGAAVIDDVLGVLVLSALVVAENGGNLLEPLLKLALFGGLAYGVGRWLVPLLDLHHHRFGSTDARVTFALAIALAFAWVAWTLGGLAEVTGAYLAGVLLTRTELGREIHEPIAKLGHSIFIPIFFLLIGLQVTSGDLRAAPFLTAATIVVAVLTKLIGCGLPAVAMGESRAVATRVGAGMVGRGEIALVVASVGLAEGVVDGSVFSVAVVVTIATTVATPLLLKLAYRANASSGEERGQVLSEAPAGGG